MSTRKLWVEVVKQSIAGRVLSSDLREATPEDIQHTNNCHRNGECDHGVIYDEPGFVYHQRYCGVCGAFVDFI